MQLRTFLAKDMKAALSCVRKEMGPDAVIVASERAKNGGVMVRAAVDGPEPTAEFPDTEKQDAESQPQDFADKYHDGLIRRLRGEKSDGAPKSRNFDRAQLLELLRLHRAPDSLAHDLAKTAQQSGLSDMTLALACALDRRMHSQPLDVPSCNALLLLGPNGAGKTAVAAKIAAHARLTHRSVRLIAADAQGAGAVARLETFGNHLGAETVVADSADAIVKAIAKAAKDRYLAIVDTAGFDPRHSKLRTAFAGVAAIDGIETAGVVSACGDAEEVGEITQALLQLGAKHLIVTCLDLARRLGAVTAAATRGLALAHVTRSPYVAGGLETLTPLSLARLLIDAGSGDADTGSTQ
jgi:flagellar biosynthesis protein FlhF